MPELAANIGGDILAMFGGIDIPISRSTFEEYVYKNWDNLSAEVSSSVHWLLLGIHRTHGADCGIETIGTLIGIDLANAVPVPELLGYTTPNSFFIPPTIGTLEATLRLRAAVDVWDEVNDCDEEQRKISGAYLQVMNKTVVLLHDIWWNRMLKHTLSDEVTDAERR